MNDQAAWGHGDELVATLLESAPPSTPSERDARGKLVNDLHDDVYRGYPVARLRPLLGSDNPEANIAGLWIASELGRNALDIAEDVIAFLGDERRSARFYAEQILAHLEDPPTDLISAVLSLIRDDTDMTIEDGQLADCALTFLRRARSHQIREITERSATSRIRDLAMWLLTVDVDPAGAVQIAERLTRSEHLDVLFAAAAAARIRDRTTEPLESAAESDFEVIRRFAGEQLEGHSKGDSG